MSINADIRAVSLLDAVNCKSSYGLNNLQLTSKKQSVQKGLLFSLYKNFLENLICQVWYTFFIKSISIFSKENKIRNTAFTLEQMKAV